MFQVLLHMRGGNFLENRNHRKPNVLKNGMGSMRKEEGGIKAVCFKLQHALESPAIVLKCRCNMEPETLRVLQAPRGGPAWLVPHMGKQAPKRNNSPGLSYFILTTMLEICVIILTYR